VRDAVDNNNYYTRRSFANAVLRRGRGLAGDAGREGRRGGARGRRERGIRERGRSEVDKVGAGNGRSLACPVMRGSGKG